MFGRLLCLLGRHRRARSKVVRTPEGVVSRCRRCGARMRRSEEGRWTLAPKA